MVAKTSYARYYGQLGVGGIAYILNPVTTARVRFPWTDLNSDGFVQANELDTSRILNWGGNYDPYNPSVLRTPNRVDPNLKNDTTDEFILGIDHELVRGLAVSASYIYRKYGRFMWEDTVRLTNADWVARTYTPPASLCPGSARCVPITYYEPVFRIPSERLLTNIPDRERVFNGFELVTSRRYADRWMFTASYAYNSAVNKYNSPASYEDPTNVDKLHNAQYAPESGGSGIDNVFTNAKGLVRLQGLYTLPWYDISVSGFYNARQGYPFPQAILSPARANGAGQVLVLLDPMGRCAIPTSTRSTCASTSRSRSARRG